MPEINDIDDIIEEDSEKEKPINENYEVKKSTFKMDRPKIEQFFDRKKILIVLGIIGVLSVVLALTLKPAKQEKDNGEKTPLATSNTIDITEEVPEDVQPVDIVEDPNAIQNGQQGIPETTTLDQYDSMLGPQYSDNESYSAGTPSSYSSENSAYGDDSTAGMGGIQDTKKSYGKSPIGFNSKKESTTSNTSSNEQQIMVQQQGIQPILPQQQEIRENQVTDTTQNRQESKRKFIETQRNKSYYSTNTVMPPLSRYELKTGTMIPAVLLTAINSDLPGEIMAQVTNDVHDFRTLKHTLIPKGSRIIGRYDSNVTYGQNRLLVVWDRIIFPNGNTLALDNYQGVDLLGNSGMKGKVNNHFWKLLRSVILSAGINVAAGRLEDINVNVGSSSKARVSIGRGASDASGNIETIGSRMVEKDLNQQPTIKIKRGSRFNIFVNSDMVLPVYGGRN
jgi:conjugation trbI family protein